MNKVRHEKDLYKPMCDWLKRYMDNFYKGELCDIVARDTHSVFLDKVLEEYGILKFFPQATGLKIEIDVLGMAIWKNKAEIFFIEAKKDPLTLRDLGQLWAYCRLCDPENAFLLSSGGLGTLNRLLNDFKREDLLNFGNGKVIKMMTVAMWDVNRGSIDYNSAVPKDIGY